MKKIFTTILLSALFFSSSFANVGETLKLTADDILQAKMFYIDWQGYLKENEKLVKIEWIEFYSIAGQRYIKKDWKIIKVSENKIYKINWINYVKDNNKLTTLEKYLETNKVTWDESNQTTTYKEVKTEENIDDSAIEDIFTDILDIDLNNIDETIDLNSAEEVVTEEVMPAEEVMPEETVTEEVITEEEDINTLLQDIFK